MAPQSRATRKGKTKAYIRNRMPSAIVYPRSRSHSRVRFRKRARSAVPRRSARPVATAGRTRTRARSAVPRRTGIKGVGIHSGIGSTSFWKARAHRMKLSQRVLSNISGKNLYQFNLSARFQCADGRQGVYDVLYYDQYPLQRMFSGIAPGPNPTRKLFIKNMYAEFTLTNATNAVTYLNIYDVYFKRELDVNDSTHSLPSLAWDNGEKQEGQALGCNYLGSQPTRIGLFNDFYKVAKKSSHLMAPGEVHKHKVLLRPNKFISFNRVNSSIRYSGLTAATLFVVAGTPADASGASELDPADIGRPGIGFDASGNPVGAPVTVTSTPAAINCVYNVRYEFHWLDDIDSDIVADNNLSTGNTLEVMPNTGVAAAYDAT